MQLDLFEDYKILEIVNTGEELIKAINNNKNIKLEKNLYEMLLESNWNSIMSEELKEYKKNHIIEKGEKYD